MNAPLPPPTSPTLRGLFDIKVFLETGQSRKSGEAGQAEVFPPEKNAAKNKSKKLVSRPVRSRWGLPSAVGLFSVSLCR